MTVNVFGMVHAARQVGAIDQVVVPMLIFPERRPRNTDKYFGSGRVVLQSQHAVRKYILSVYKFVGDGQFVHWACRVQRPRSEEHTSELQSRENLVCRLLLEKKK